MRHETWIVAFLSLAGVACSEVAAPTSPPTIDAVSSNPISPPSQQAGPNLLTGARFWVDPLSNAVSTANAWRATRPADAAQMEKIASQGTAKWIGNWNTSVEADVRAAVSAMLATGATPLLVSYNIPQRDCGGMSSGNATTAQAYRGWIAAFAQGIGGRKAVVVLEPDALAGMDCLSPGDQQTRFDLMKFAIQTLTAAGNVAVYVDAGHPRWQSVTTMAARLNSAGIALAAGFSLNVSNFVYTTENVSFGTQLSSLVGGKHFVIDTGRNGLGPTSDNQWCNPAGRALGERPGTPTGNVLVDAFLWVKTPGESDGACNGAPAAGTWMPEYALGLATRG